MTKLVVPPVPEVERVGPSDFVVASVAISSLDDLEAWGSLGWQTAQREAALADELAEALERIKGHTCADVAPGTPSPDPLWINFIATRALTKHKEARNG